MTERRFPSDVGPWTIVPEWVVDANVSDRALRLYVLLGLYADRDGESHPFRRTLADRLRCSVNSLDRAVAELLGINALEKRERQRAHGGTTANGWLLKRVAPGEGAPPLRPPGPTGGEGGAPPLGPPNKNQKHLNQSPLPGTDAALTGDAVPSPVGALVAGYVDDYARERHGHRPSRQWIGIAGREVRKALDEGETVEHVRGCLYVIAHEGKSPAMLPHVVADSHRGKPRREP